MLTKLLHSATIGMVVAVLLLFLLPELRTNTNDFFSSSTSMNEQPASFNQAVRRAAPAVVNVYSGTLNNTYDHNLAIRNLGSGVLMNEKGYIMTNKHVINNADQIIVALQDGRIFEASVIGSDTLTDLAVLKIDAINLSSMLINSKRIPHIGDIVLAIGNPYNLGQTVTQGIISATGRNGLSPFGRQHFLQTDASINQGNSGGALVNSLGELVGINTLSLDKTMGGEMPEGIGFAIPSLLATRVMEKLIRDGRVIRGYIGIGGSENTGPEGNSPTHSETKKIQGVIVRTLDPNGPAARSGILLDDVIITVNNKPATSVIEVMDQIAEIRPGAEIPIQLIRGERNLTLSLTVTEYPIH